MYIMEIKCHGTNQTNFVEITPAGQTFIDKMKLKNTNLDEMERMTLLYEIQKNYLVENEIDWNNYRLHMVTDEDGSSQII